MAEPTESRYDLFVVHADADRAWVDGYLRHAVGVEPGRLVTPRDFDLGAPIPAEFDRTVASSRYTALVLSPAFLADRWAEFGEQLVSFTSVDEGRGRLVTLTLHPCQPPLHLRFRVGLDLTDWTRWDEQIARLRGLLDAPAPPPEVIPCPYPGMVPFRAEDTSLFRGREREIDDLLRGVRAHSFLLVVGPSGSGKSSLISAGLLPRLDDPNHFPAGSWRIRALRPGPAPLARLAEQLGGDPHRPAETIAALLEASPPARKLLLFVDQFEELFTQVVTRDAQHDFIRALKGLRDDPRCMMIVAMRADFYPDLMNSPLWPVDREQIVDIAPLRGEALRRAIVAPAEAVGVYLEDVLVERLIDDAADEPGALPMLQEALVLLWAKRERRLLTRAAYDAMGRDGRSGLAVAMATKADATLAALPPAEQRLARRIFLRLVQFGEGRPDTRRQLDEQELVSAGDPPEMLGRVLGRLIDNKLLTADSVDRGRRRIDIAHEMLIVGWPASRDWVRARREAELTRRRLEEKAREWSRLGRGLGGLLDETELPEAERWLASDIAADLGYDRALADLVEASHRRHEALRLQSLRRLRSTIAGLAAGLVVVAALAIWGGLSTRWARRAEATARDKEQAAIDSAKRAKAAEGLAKARAREATAAAIEVAIQRGAWRRARSLIDQALAAEPDDPIGLRLDRVRALCALQDVPGAVREIRALAEEPNLGKYEGAIFLWRGDIEWDLTSAPAGPLALIREGVRKGIRGADERRERADREYAEGMLAGTVAEAMMHYRAAIGEMPSHQRANSMLVPLLILTGDFQGAREQIAVAEILVPEDPAFRILDSWVSASEGRLDEANAILDKAAGAQPGDARPLLNAVQLDRARVTAKLLNRCRTLELSEDTSSWLALLRECLKAASRDPGLLDPGRSAETSLFVPVPPVLMTFKDDVYGLVPAVLMVRFRGYDPIHRALTRIIAIHPDGLFYMLQGLFLGEDESLPESERYARAEATLVEASESRSLVPVQLAAKCQAMKVQYLLGLGPPRRPDMLEKAARTMRDIVDSGQVRPDQVEYLARVAASAGDWDRARWLLARWRKNVPEGLRPRIEYEAHAYDRAIEATDQILQGKPGDEGSLNVRAAALKALGRLQERFQMDQPPAARPR